MPERSSSAPSLGNILAFAAVFILAMVVYPFVMSKFFPPPPQVANAPAENEKKEGEKADAKKEDKAVAQKKNEADKKNGANKEPKPSEEPVDKSAPAMAAKPEAVKPAAKDDDERGWITIGSVDPDLKENPFRMGATFSRVGGSLVRLEFSSEHYRDLDDRSGYLGHLVMDRSDRKPGCLVQVVVPGTPADKAGIKPGDRITGITYRGKNTAIGGVEGLETILRTTEPEDEIELTIRRGDAQNRDPKNKKEEQVSVTLIRRPLEVIRPERRMPTLEFIRNGPTDAIDPDVNCPRPFLTTLQQVDEDKLRADEDPNAKFDEELSRELPNVHLRDVPWTIESPRKNAAGVITKVAFSCEVPQYHLKVTKTYELAKLPGNAATDGDDQAYHLTMSVAITNNDTKKHEVAYRQDGPNGLPVEGFWYVSSKVNRKWFTIEGMRDVVYQTTDSEVGVVTCSELGEKVEKTEKFRREIGEASQFAEHHPLFFGVDAQYFSVAMLPDRESTAPNIERAIALRVGDVAEEVRQRTLTNTSFRLIGKTATIEPGKTSAPQSYEIFAGPKRQELLDNYQLSGLIYYGLTVFRMVAMPMTHVLDFFYKLVHNYGLAIIMLTVVVRLCMFPLSRKQAINAQMMQKLQPEMKAIQLKYKKDPEAARKAQMELYSKHNYNPAQACLPMFIQLPIFMGLYRALQVNIELRDAPLISSAVRWCSNLAAPDMLFDWSRFMPPSVNNGIGFSFPLLGPALGLGPYLNLLPIITVALYLIQQKVMMPPAADEQAATQQKMMKYMMIFVGLMFYKVAAGLCVYFIATTIWSLAERRFVPKAAAAGVGNDDEPAEVKMKVVKQPRLTDSEREAIRRQKRKK
jgi:YidC/Oxa1 family membrane protein insertase